jgi:NADH-quinone oxidoreductase subunit N
LTGACIVVSFDYLKNGQINLYEYSILLMCALLGLMLFVSSFDLISMYLSLELQSLSFYILATWRRDSAFSAEAGLKYFILGALSSGFLLFGISLI